MTITAIGAETSNVYEAISATYTLTIAEAPEGIKTVTTTADAQKFGLSGHRATSTEPIIISNGKKVVR